MALISYEQLKEVLQDFKTKIQAKFVENITFDDSIDVATNKPKNTLKKTINGQPEEVINHVVTEWQDLKYTTQSTNFNIFNPSTFKDGEYYNSIGTLEKTTDWGNFKIPCRNGDTFTLFKKAHDSINLGLLNGGRWVQNLQITQRTNDNGWEKYTITIPQTGQFDSISIPVHNQRNNYKSEVMLFSDVVNAPNEYIPFTNNKVVSIDGSKVALTFDPTGSSLKSSTTYDAIKELDGKIASTGGGGTVTSVNNVQPQGGNVTIDSTNINTTATNQTVQQALDNKVETSRVGNNAGQIPQIDGTGKLVTSIMPDLAITSVQVVANEAEMMRLTNIQVGDVVVVENEDNKTYMCKDETQTDKDKKFVAINTGLSVVKVINSQRPDATGSLTLNGTHINVDGQNNTTIKEELEKCVKSVNGETPRADGNVTINAGQINGVYNSAGNLQSHLNTIKNSIDTVTSRANNNSNRIGALERKKPTIHVGEIITTFKDNGDSYTLNGVTYLYCGKANNLITSANYPELTAALGLTGVASYNLPVINDIEISYDYTRRARRKHYIVAKIS